jgi:iron complex transport system permease protein
VTGEVRVRALGGRVALRLPARALAVLVLLLASLALVAGASLLAGSYGLAPIEVWAALRGELPNDMSSTVVWEFRLPRLLAAALTGAMFALAGALLQGLTRNPLADPSLVGVSQGASLAVVALIVAVPGTGAGVRSLAAFGGALATAALILWLSRGREAGGSVRFILMGIGVAAFISALTSSLLTYGRLDDALAALAWLAGSIHSAGWGEVHALALVLLALVPALVWAARPLGPIGFGPDMATGLGVPVRSVRTVLTLLAVALAGIAVAAVGPLSFVGLVAPHMARRLARSGPGLHLALSAATGALMVATADLVGRAAFAPLQIPAGIVTALIGAPAFVVLLARSQARRTL